MSWATAAIVKLQAGETVTLCPRGNSMAPIIKSGEEVTLEPITPETMLLKGDIVLVHVAGHDYLHLIHSLKFEQTGMHGPARTGVTRYQIGNNHGRINGWVGRDHIYGRKV